jgi:hypothetical protein
MTAEACPLRHERAQYASHADLKRRRGVIEALLGRPAGDTFFEYEAEYFPGRLRIVRRNIYCIVHRNVPDMLVWDRAGPRLRTILLRVLLFASLSKQLRASIHPGSRPVCCKFLVKISFGRMADLLRPSVHKMFEKFFYSHTRGDYPQFDFRAHE